MIGPISKHPFETLGFRAKVIGGTLGSHKLPMHLSLFIFQFYDKLSFKHPSETFGFRVRMITWTLESYVLFILSLLSLSFNSMMNLFSPKYSKSPSLGKRTYEKGSRVATFPILCSLCLYILSHAIFHVFILIYYVPYSSIVLRNMGRTPRFSGCGSSFEILGTCDMGPIFSGI
jgi:hypothetical protein